MSDQTKAPEILTREDGSMIAYRHTAGKSPGVMFLTGFKSDMQGGKAIALEKFCISRGHAFTRFDYFGHGESSGAFEDGTIGRWADDAVHVLDNVAEGPQILVGSSMGGWIMLLCALERPDRVAGLVGIAAAPDFTRDLIPPALTPDQLSQMDRQGYCDIPNCYDDQEPYRIRKSLLDEGDNHLLLNREIDLDMPVRLIHGIEDADVPWQTALKIMQQIKSADVEIQFVKAGDHRLSEPQDLDRLTRTVATLLEKA
ncbi:alpha/beta hydrolase [Thalassospiraceae bacterium LMO-JJ14]|nr:alpha/beta hydrolase [Thalassospiraceae bacterium LMO-JJ14]